MRNVANTFSKTECGQTIMQIVFPSVFANTQRIHILLCLDIRVFCHVQEKANVYSISKTNFENGSKNIKHFQWMSGLTGQMVILRHQPSMK